MKRTRSRYFWLFAIALAGSALGAAPVAVQAAPATECTGYLIGTTHDSIKVPDGATCLLYGVTVEHSVTVGEDAFLYSATLPAIGNDPAIETTIGQQVHSKDARSVMLFDTHVFGGIDISGTTGMTWIGTSECGVDPIADANIHLHDNFGPIAVCQMTIRNNLTIQNNHDVVFLSDNTVGNNIHVTQNDGQAIVIRDNTVVDNILVHQNSQSFALLIYGNDMGQNLNCTSNDVDPIHVANTVDGQRLGECAGPE